MRILKLVFILKMVIEWFVLMVDGENIWKCYDCKLKRPSKWLRILFTHQAVEIVDYGEQL